MHFCSDALRVGACLQTECLSSLGHVKLKGLKCHRMRPFTTFNESLMKYATLFEISTDAFNQSQRLWDALQCRLFWFGLKWSGGGCESIHKWLIGNRPVYFLRRMATFLQPQHTILSVTGNKILGNEGCSRQAVGIFFTFLGPFMISIELWLCWICEDPVIG